MWMWSTMPRATSDKFSRVHQSVPRKCSSNSTSSTANGGQVTNPIFNTARFGQHILKNPQTCQRYAPICIPRARCITHIDQDSWCGSFVLLWNAHSFSESWSLCSLCLGQSQTDRQSPGSRPRYRQPHSQNTRTGEIRYSNWNGSTHGRGSDEADPGNVRIHPHIQLSTPNATDVLFLLSFFFDSNPPWSSYLSFHVDQLNGNSTS